MTVPTIRPATAEDADRLRRIYAAVVADTAISFEESPPDADEMSRRMVAEPRLPWLVADRGGQVAGYAYAALHRQRPAYRWSAECSVYVDAAHRSQGVGRLLYERLIEEVRGLGYVSLFAGIALPNPGSVALHEAVGFAPSAFSRRSGTSTAAGTTSDGGARSWSTHRSAPPNHAPGNRRPANG